MKDEIRKIENDYCGKSSKISLNVDVTNILHDYRTSLKSTYHNLPAISKQGWFDHSINANDVEKQYVDVTLVKSIEKNQNDIEDYSSLEQMIEGEDAYSTYQYIHFDEIFDVDSSIHHLFLIEGNGGTGKTTFIYRVFKYWAEELVLQQYYLIVLVQLRDLKPSNNISLESLFCAMGQSQSHDICTEVSNIFGQGILIWLEGWDELDDKLMHSSVFEDLLSGNILPQATVVITTRPSATRCLKKFNFTHKFKLIGFTKEQIKKYVLRHCADDGQSNVAENFMDNISIVPGIAHLAAVPLYLAILVKLFKAERKLPEKITDICIDFLMFCLQHQKEKLYGNTKPICSLDDLPPDMHKIFHNIQKCAYEKVSYHSQEPFTEEEISQLFFDNFDVPHYFDGLGMFTVRNAHGKLGQLKSYDFVHKPIQEMLAALYLTRLKPHILQEELCVTFKNKEFEMVRVFYAGITNQVPSKGVLKEMSLHQKPITLPAESIHGLIEAWKCCHKYYQDMINDCSREFLLSLIMCCYEAQNSKACREIANHIYADKVCRFEIPPNHATPYLLLAISYFLSYSGKTWSLRCNTVIQSRVELLFKHINDHHLNCLWVFCCVVTPSEIDDFCNAIKSQLSLQWIHLLPGSNLGDDGTQKLCQCFNSDSPVIKIEIDDCGIGKDGLGFIAQMLSVNSKILYIDIRNNKYELDDIKELLQNIKNQQHLQCLLLDKTFCENSEIRAMLKDINLIRKENSVTPIKISNQGTDVLRNYNN